MKDTVHPKYRPFYTFTEYYHRPENWKPDEPATVLFLKPKLHTSLKSKAVGFLKGLWLRFTS